MSSRVLFALTSAVLLLGVGIASAADQPTLLGVSKSWTSATTGSGSSKVCYTMAHPTSSTPKKAKRDPIGFLVSDWPTRNAASEPQVVPGYPYKEGSTVTVEIGPNKFSLVPKNTVGAGGAWVKDSADEARLIDAMKGGATMIVTGISTRGTTTKDTYSLSGFSTALDKIHSSCTS